MRATSINWRRCMGIVYCCFLGVMLCCRSRQSYDDSPPYGVMTPGSSSAIVPRSPTHRGAWKREGDDTAKNFKVVIRVRPPLQRELSGDRPFVDVVKVDSDCCRIMIAENLAALEESGLQNSSTPYSGHVFTFDHVYDQHCDQKTVYETTAKAVVESSLQGYNATIFAYGQVSLRRHAFLALRPVFME